jgi:FHS family L-fucose permease-like MFS transporter
LAVAWYFWTEMKHDTLTPQQKKELALSKQ